MSVNLRRRHLSASQKAAIATESLPLFEAEAKERKRILSGTRSNPGEVPAKLPEPAIDARDQAAAATGASPRYVSDAKRIKAESPEAFEQIKAGTF